MQWEYKITESGDVEVYDHKGDNVITVKNPDPPGIIRSNGTVVKPNVQAAICDYVCGLIENDDFSNDSAKHDYVEAAQTILSADQIKERDSEQS